MGIGRLGRRLTVIGAATIAAASLAATPAGAVAAASAKGPTNATHLRKRVRQLHPHIDLHGARSPFKIPHSAAHGVISVRPSHFALKRSTLCAEACAGPLLYWGENHGTATVMSDPKVYLIQWEPSEPSNNGQLGTSFTPLEGSYSPEIESFLRNVAADSASHLLSNAFSVDNQYGDLETGAPGRYSSEFGGLFVDRKPYPERSLAYCPASTEASKQLPSPTQPCISDSEPKPQLAEQVGDFVEEHGLPTGLNAIYFVLTPKGVASCAGGEGEAAECSSNAYCAYHSQLEDRSGHLVIYANMPYDDWAGCETPDQPQASRAGIAPPGQRPADDEIDVLSHEFNEAVTDPTGQSWFDIGGNEVGDKCTYPFFDPAVDFYPAADAYGAMLGGTPATYNEATGEVSALGTAYNQEINGAHYLLQREWSNAAEGCVARAPVPAPAFGSYPSSAVAGSPVSFNASGSTNPAGAITAYEWSFGDGSAALGAEAQHAYGAPGTYTVTLTVSNNSGASATTTRQLSVGPPPPPPAPEVITRTTIVTSTRTVPRLVEQPIARYTLASLASALHLPRNHSRVPGLASVTLGRALCPPACGVRAQVFASPRAGARKPQLIGDLKETVESRGSAAIALRLTRSGARLLKKAKRLSVRLVLRIEDREGATWTLTRNLILTSKAHAAARRKGHAARRGRHSRRRRR